MFMAVLNWWSALEFWEIHDRWQFMDVVYDPTLLVSSQGEMELSQVNVVTVDLLSGKLIVSFSSSDHIRYALDLY